MYINVKYYGVVGVWWLCRRVIWEGPWILVENPGTERILANIADFLYYFARSLAFLLRNSIFKSIFNCIAI